MADKVTIRTFSSTDELMSMVHQDLAPLLAEAAKEAKPFTDKHGAEWNALHNGDYAAYQKLKTDGRKFDWVDPCGRYPIHVAAHGGNVPIITDLLDTFGQKLNQRMANDDGETPILSAVSSMRVAAIQYLKRRGADLDVQPKMTNNFHDRVKAYGLDL